MERDSFTHDRCETESSIYANHLNQQAALTRIINKINSKWQSGQHFKFYGGIGIFKGFKKLPNLRSIVVDVKWLTCTSRKPELNIGAFLKEAQPFDTDELPVAA